jgi:hypothetical protein
MFLHHALHRQICKKPKNSRNVKTEKKTQRHKSSLPFLPLPFFLGEKRPKKANSPDRSKSILCPCNSPICTISDHPSMPREEEAKCPFACRKLQKHIVCPSSAKTIHAESKKEQLCAAVLTNSLPSHYVQINFIRRFPAPSSCHLALSSWPRPWSSESDRLSRRRRLE